MKKKKNTTKLGTIIYYIDLMNDSDSSNNTKRGTYYLCIVNINQ